ncbi:MAG: membrane protein YqaA with SNARE-associated domain [Gammaproteobacteria bacterium]
MKLFKPLYDLMMRWSRHRHAPAYLCIVSAAESSFFPLPTAMMLAPMCLANRSKSWWLATICTLASVFGGVLGYFIGMYLFDAVGQQIIDFYNAQTKFDTAMGWFDTYGVWIVFIAGFSPIPYKLFTITSGMLGLALLPFIVASLVGRAGQFFLVAGLLYFGGERLEKSLQRYVEWIGWGVVIAIVGAYFFLKH